MEISSAAAFPASILRRAQPGATEEAQAFALKAEPPVQAKSADEIYAQYDMHNISPREIDQLHEELRAQGHTDEPGFLMLLTRGEEFQRHLSESLGGTSTSDYTRKIDLVGQVKDQLQRARAMGDATQGHEDLLALLARHDGIRLDVSGP